MKVFKWRRQAHQLRHLASLPVKRSDKCNKILGTIWLICWPSPLSVLVKHSSTNLLKIKDGVF